MEERTSIQVTRQTRELLGQIGRKGQTYDEVIVDLVRARSCLYELKDAMMKNKKEDEKEEAQQNNG